MTVRYQIVMRSGPNPNATYALEASQTTIGRDSSNTIAINDPEISRHHARMTQQGGKIVLEDLGSTNGTSVDGNRLSAPHVLKAGETISFGEDIIFVFEAQAFDPDATVASSAASFNQASQQQPHAYQQPQPAAAPRQEPVYSQPQPPQPQPAQEYVGQIPANPVLTTPPPASAQPRRKVLPIALAISALILLCSCGAFFWWIDHASLWCTFFPFFFGAACG